MKKTKQVLLAVLFCAFVLSPVRALAQNTQDFNFSSFDSDYFLKKEPDGSSTMSVNEVLVANFPQTDQNHGILRAIPQVYDGHSLHISSMSVSQDGQPAQYSKSSENDNLVLKIGNANTYVHGAVTYRINYTLHDVVKFFPDHDEIFWDINGDQWQQTFGVVSARVHIPKNLAQFLEDRQKCYEGVFGSNEQNCSIRRTDAGDEVVISSNATNVGSGQTLSIVMGFQPGTFKLSDTVLKDQQRQRVEFIGAAVLAVVPPVFAFVFMFGRWRAFGNDPKGRGVIIPEYEPPKGFDTLNSDFLLEQGLRNNAVSATIIDLAVKGYITIIEIPKSGIFGKKDYELKLNRLPGEDISKQVVDLMETLFKGNLTAGGSVKVSEFKKDFIQQQAMYKRMKKLEDALSSELTKNGYFIKNPKKVRTGYQVWALILFFISFFLFPVGVDIAGGVLLGLAAGLMLASVIVFIFSFIMPARTEIGVRAHDDLLGLKDYIKLAEADRLKFLQSPEGAEKLPVADQFDPKTPEAKVKLFEKLLPYAMLFGLEKDWAKQFEGIYASSPGWYQGNPSAFTAGYLAGSIGDFNTASMTSFATPSSSSGSGFSGGGAGGGGGGGGGGGW